MARRPLIALLTALLAAGLTVAGASAGIAADGPLPIRPGPGDAVREPAPFGARVVGGTPVTDGVYPFQAAPLYQPGGTNDYQRQFCGGSLITPTQVLTAAHCVEFFGTGAGQLPLADLRVVVGRTVLTSTQGQKRRAVSVAIHPGYVPATFSHDVAVINLAAPVTGIRPVAVVTPGTDALERPGTSLTVTGWGNTVAQPAGPGGGGVFFPDRLRQASVPIVSPVDCRTAYGTAGVPLDASMLCAGRTNLDTCQGDSGGPLFVKAVGSTGYLQVGITSWASAAARPASPACTPG